MCGDVFQEEGTAREKALRQGNSEEATHSGWRAVSKEEAGNEVREVRRDRVCGVWSGLPLLLGARWEAREGSEQRRDLIQVPSQQAHLSLRSLFPWIHPTKISLALVSAEAISNHHPSLPHLLLWSLPHLAHLGSFPTVSSWECRRRQRPGLCSGFRDLLLWPVKGPQVRSFQNINGITFWMRWRQTCLFDDGALKVSVAWK